MTAQLQIIELGEHAGHSFRGNQHTGGMSEALDPSPRIIGNKTVEKAEGRIRNVIGGNLGPVAAAIPADERVNLTVMEAKLATEIADRITAFAKEFPDAAARIGAVTASGSLGSSIADTRVSPDGDAAIRYNASDFADAQALSDQLKGPNNLTAVDTTAGITDHELGHVIDLMAPSSGSLGAGPVWSTYAVNDISQYAATSDKEAVAEAFAARQAGESSHLPTSLGYQLQDVIAEAKMHPSEDRKTQASVFASAFDAWQPACAGYGKRITSQAFGEGAGHAFRGNQWTGGSGLAEAISRMDPSIFYEERMRQLNPAQQAELRQLTKDLSTWDLASWQERIAARDSGADWYQRLDRFASESPPVSETLYRGTGQEVTEGEHISMPLSNWSTDRETSNEYIRSEGTKTGSLLVLPPSQEVHAFDASLIDKDPPPMFNYIAGGDFVVTSKSDTGQAILAPAPRTASAEFGDSPGHPFRGNQWREGEGATVTNGVAWMTSQKTPEEKAAFQERLGNCYPLSGQYVTNHPDATLVHGTIQGMGFPPNPHAWVENADGTIHEPASDRNWTPEAFKDYFHPVVNDRYSSQDAARMMVGTGHYGPWTDQERKTAEFGEGAGHAFRGNQYTGGGGRSVDPTTVHSIADLRRIADSGKLPPDTAKDQYFYHAVRYPAELDSILTNGLRPGPGASSVFLSKDEVRDRGAGFAIVRVPTEPSRLSEGIDAVSPGLMYREFTTDQIPNEDVVNVVRDVPSLQDSWHTTEDKLAQLAITHQGDDSSFLPPEYQNWFHVASATAAVVQPLEMGEGVGHPFRGNQWTDVGHGGIETRAIHYVEQLYNGEKVSIPADQVATVLDVIGRQAADAKAAGREARDINLCNASVEGANMFCSDSFGIPRQDMAQLAGDVVPGSQAALDNPGEKNVDATDKFLDSLRDQGVPFTKDVVPAQELKATQDELNGAKVAGIMNADMLDQERLFREPLVVSKENYILDGHHRWAAGIGLEYMDGKLDSDVTANVYRVDAPITELMTDAKSFASSYGIKSEGIKSFTKGGGFSVVQVQILELGDSAGHPFRGNQYKSGTGEIIYHVAPASARESITKNGIDNTRSTHDRWDDASGFYAFRDKEEAKGYARTMAQTPPAENMDIWKVKATAPTTEDTGLYSNYDEPTSAVNHPEPVPADNVERVKTVHPAYAAVQVLEMGEGSGHAFRGNQHTGGIGGEHDQLPNCPPGCHERELAVLHRDNLAIEGKLGDAMRPTNEQFEHTPERMGQWAPEREALHNEIVANALRAAEERGVPQDSQMVLMGGLPGAGKSSATEDILNPKDWLTISPDDVKLQLAERGDIPTPDGMKAMEASPLVGDEAMKVSWDLADQATAQGYNVVWDMTGDDASWYSERIQNAQSTLPESEPYKTTGIFVDVPIDQSKDQVSSRYAKGAESLYGGRPVPQDYIERSRDPQYGSTQRRAFEESRSLLNQVMVIDNTDHKQQVVEKTPGFSLD